MCVMGRIRFRNVKIGLRSSAGRFRISEEENTV